MENQPRGYFSFESKGEKIEGRICTWSMNKFCERMDIKNITEMYTVLTTGISFTAVAELLRCSVEYLKRNEGFTIDQAMDWIDDMGGLDRFVKVINSTMTVEDDGKKKEVEAY